MIRPNQWTLEYIGSSLSKVDSIFYVAYQLSADKILARKATFVMEYLVIPSFNNLQLPMLLLCLFGKVC